MELDPENGLFKDYLTKTQAASLLNRSEDTLDRWARLKVGPVRTKVGRTTLYRKDDLRAWLLAQREEVGQWGAA